MPLPLIALFLAAFAFGTTEFVIAGVLPQVAEGLGVSVPSAGYLVSGYALGIAIGGPLLTLATSKVSRKALLIALAIAFTVGQVACAVAPDFLSMLALRVAVAVAHGAYFGVAALVAASLVGPKERTTAIARVMLGLTVATIIGVPAATYLGQVFGWQAGFALTGFLALATFIMVALFAPRDRPDEDASPLRELGAFRNRQVLLTLATAIVGFGGLFAVYSYTASTLLAVTKVDPRLVPLVIGLFGVGMTLGNLVSAWAADKALKPTATVLLIASAAALFAFPYSVGALWSISLVVFLVGCTTGLAIVLQTYLMDVARDACCRRQPQRLQRRQRPRPLARRPRHFRRLRFPFGGLCRLRPVAGRARALGHHHDGRETAAGIGGRRMNRWAIAAGVAAARPTSALPYPGRNMALEMAKMRSVPSI